MSTTQSKDARRRRLEYGIYERERSDGTRVLELLLKVNSKLRKRTLPVGTTLAQARKARTKLAAERDAGRSLLGVRDDPRLTEASELAMQAMWQRTNLTGKGKVSERTVEGHEQRLRDYVHPLLGHRKLSTIRKADVLGLIAAVRAEGRADWTVHHVTTALRCVLRYARENDLMAADPFAGIPSELLPAQEAKTPTPVYRAEDVNRFLSEVKGTRDRAAATVFSDAGLRTMELCGLRWRNVSLTEGFISVEGQLARRRREEPVRIVATKSRAGVRGAPLTPRARERLEALYAEERARGLGDDGDFVFATQTGGPLDPSNLRRTFRRAAKAAGVGHITPKTLRTSLATAYAEADVDEHVAASFTGHTPIVYREHYVRPHRDQRERENAVKRLLDSGYGTE
jgi:integrase